MRAFCNILILCVLISTATGASQTALEDVLDVSALSGDQNCAGADEGLSCHLSLLQGKAEALRRMQAMNSTDPVEGTCKVEGNPDTIIGFDQAHTSWLHFFLSFFHLASDEGEPVSQNGDMWLVKSPSVQIQGRYNGNKKGRTLRGIAVSGTFISNNVIRIGTLQQKIFFNDEEILSEPESKFQLQKVVDASRSIITNTTKNINGQRDEINLELGSNLKMIVKRRMNDLDIQITMLQADEGQDGQCGNFNGDPNDDTAELITDRLMVEIPKDMVLFTHSFGDKENQPTKDLKPTKDLRIGETKPHAQLAAKNVDDVQPYDCVNYPLPGQVLRFGNPSYPFKLYHLNPFNGSYQEVYTIPYEWTSPPFEDLNSCAISPISSVLYCTVAMPDGNPYVARIGATGIQFVGKLPATPDKFIAGTFGPSGVFHFSEVGRRQVTLYKIPNLDGDSGFTDQNDPNLADYSNLEGMTVLKVADWVAFQASIQGHDSEWMMGVTKGGRKTVLINTATNELTKLNSQGLPSDNAAYGAGWNFQNRIFFASNDGEGVFEANVASIDIAGGSISYELVGQSVSTDFNDGLNCLTRPPPSNWVPSWVTTTTTTTIITTGECTVYGDPHVVGFDMEPAKLAAFLSSDSSEGDSVELGDLWLVRSSFVRIQGRYNLVDSSSKKVFLKALALGGPFLQNNTLLISHNRKVWWNDEEILTTLPSRYSNRLISASFYENALLVQDPTRQGRAPGLDLSLPLDVNLRVTEGKNGLGVSIKMPPLSDGQDGLCGNFNGRSYDDALELVSKRLAAHVAPAELLFRHRFSTVESHY